MQPAHGRIYPEVQDPRTRPGPWPLASPCLTPLVSPTQLADQDLAPGSTAPASALCVQHPPAHCPGIVWRPPATGTTGRPQGYAHPPGPNPLPPLQRSCPPLPRSYIPVTGPTAAAAPTLPCGHSPRHALVPNTAPGRRRQASQSAHCGLMRSATSPRPCHLLRLPPLAPFPILSGHQVADGMTRHV